VNFDDLLVLAKNYNKTGATFDQGDFNYDGTVNFDDLLILAKAYNMAAPAPVAPVAAAPVTAAESASDPLLTSADRKAPVFSTTRVAKPAPVKPRPAARPGKR